MGYSSAVTVFRMVKTAHCGLFKTVFHQKFGIAQLLRHGFLFKRYADKIRFAVESISERREIISRTVRLVSIIKARSVDFYGKRVDGFGKIAFYLAELSAGGQLFNRNAELIFAPITVKILSLNVFVQFFVAGLRVWLYKKIRHNAVF